MEFTSYKTVLTQLRLSKCTWAVRSVELELMSTTARAPLKVYQRAEAWATLLQTMLGILWIVASFKLAGKHGMKILVYLKLYYYYNHNEIMSLRCFFLCFFFLHKYRYFEKNIYVMLVTHPQYNLFYEIISFLPIEF